MFKKLGIEFHSLYSVPRKWKEDKKKLEETNLMIYLPSYILIEKKKRVRVLLYF